jgi:hypothetical protein
MLFHEILIPLHNHLFQFTYALFNFFYYSYKIIILFIYQAHNIYLPFVVHFIHQYFFCLYFIL